MKIRKNVQKAKKQDYTNKLFELMQSTKSDTKSPQNIKSDKKKKTYDFYTLCVLTIKNRVIYHCAKKLLAEGDVKNAGARDFLEHVAKKGDKRKKMFNKTLKEIEKIATKNSLKYAIAKKDRTVDYISSDIDLVVKQGKDFDKWVKAFENNGWSVEDHMEFFGNKVYQRTVEKNGFYKIDLTNQFCWHGNLYFDVKFLWRNFNSADHKLSKEADFLINFATVVFKKYHFSLLDFLYLKKLSKQNLNWQQIENQTIKFKWHKTYKLIFKYFKKLNEQKMQFPKVFSIFMILRIFWQTLLNNRFSLNAFAYFVFARIRYILLPLYLPGHVWWVPMKKFKEIKKVKVEL